MATFFAEYAERYMASDVDAVSALYEAPLLAVREGRAIHLPDRAAVREHLATLMEAYNDAGAARADIAEIDVKQLGTSSVFVQEGMFFSKAAVVTFGGAYSVLAYVAQDAVNVYAWLRPGEMLDGLGLAETTPGPLILVLQFVAFIAGFRNPGSLSPHLSGLAASLVTLWVTFVPSFLWIFLGAPYVERLRENRLLRAAFAAVSAAVVGVILNLATWFALHVLFGRVTETRWGVLRAHLPDLMTLDGVAATIAITALVALHRLRARLLPTLAIGAAAGAAWVMLRR